MATAQQMVSGNASHWIHGKLWSLSCVPLAFPRSFVLFCRKYWVPFCQQLMVDFYFLLYKSKGGFQEFALQSRLSTVVESLASSQKCYCLWKHKLLRRISYSVQGSLLTEIFQRYYSRIQEVYRAVNNFKQKRNLLHAVIKTPDLFSISISIAGSGV